MYAPLPRTQQLSRSYTSQTTSKKNLNKENAHGLPSKTPSRAGPSEGPIKMGLGNGPPTGIRMGLGAKTVGRDKNVMIETNQLGGKGKGKEGEDIAPKRLFQSTSKQLPSSKSFGSFPLIPSQRLPPSTSISRNLRTPGPVHVIEQSAPTPLPSAGRTRRRSRHSITPIKSVEPSESFLTPGPSGRFDDEHNNSLEIDAVVGLGEVAEVEEVGSEDELEYMPPRAIELPYTPPWELPDLREIFVNLSALPPLWEPYDENLAFIPEPEFYPVDMDADKIKLCSGSRHILSSTLAHSHSDDDELEEPLFRKKATPSLASSRPPSNVASGTKKTVLKGVATATSAMDGTSSRPLVSGKSAVGSVAGRRPVVGNPPPIPHHPVTTVKPTTTLSKTNVMLKGVTTSKPTTSRPPIIVRSAPATSAMRPKPLLTRPPQPPSQSRPAANARGPSETATVHSKTTPYISDENDIIMKEWQDEDVRLGLEDFSLDLHIEDGEGDACLCL
ncbi:hypothetical protein P7C73_g3343, partial [Tremellales sp. Uapishka_1]